MNDSTRIWAGVDEAGLWLRIEGRAMADVCPALRSFCESHLNSGRAVLHVHLNDCEHFDSTFLGTLLCLQKVHGTAGGKSVVIVSPANSCHEALKRMGGHLLFPIETRELPASIDWQLICESGSDRTSGEFQRQVVDAHNELAAVPGPLGELYTPIARMAEQEFASRKSAPAKG